VNTLGKQVSTYLILFSLILVCLGTYVMSEVRLPALFSDHMVLQQNRTIPIWGWAEPGESVSISFRSQSAEATADEEGKFRLNLKAEKAGGPDDLIVRGADELRVQDVLVGEVWVCSGQSNMQWQVQSSNNFTEEARSATWPDIRMLTVPRIVADSPQTDIAGEWEVTSPETVGGFSAVCYFFGRDLHRKLNIPVGLLHTSWGGTPAEAWTSHSTLAADNDFVPILDRFQKALKDYPSKLKEYEEVVRRVKESKDALPPYHTDPGNKGFGKGWAKVSFNDSQWGTIQAPGYFDTTDGLAIDGSVWFRKTVQIPKEWKGRELTLELGAIDDFDVTYFNGKEVGSTGIETPNFYQHAREYRIPGKLVKAGPTTVAVRIFDHYGNGGFAGFSGQMKLVPTEGDFPEISLSGDWRYRVELELSPTAVTGPGGANLPPQPMGPGHSHSPAGLYNAMLYPLAPYAIQGAIWYQGETNASRGHQYNKLLTAMIEDWRDLWAQGDFPFGIVQLANFNAVQDNPGESDWAELRESQARVAANLPNAGLAVTIDIGEADDIHPRNKQDVGRRLALWALKKTYGNDIVFSGPTLQSIQIDQSEAYLSFQNVGTGLEAKGGELKGFSIAGSDRKYVWAKARIQGDQIVVWSDAVRYAWANNPACNHYNSEGLPAVPFRTDNWPGVTLNHR
jgi:sialate O-acetylesterase